jgi:hypothetical protein
MVLQMYIGDKLVDSAALSVAKINDVQEREWYIQGAINDMREKWSDVIGDRHQEVQFFIKGNSLFRE